MAWVELTHTQKYAGSKINGLDDLLDLQDKEGVEKGSFEFSGINSRWKYVKYDWGDLVIEVQTQSKFYSNNTANFSLLKSDPHLTSTHLSFQTSKRRNLLTNCALTLTHKHLLYCLWGPVIISYLFWLNISLHFRTITHSYCLPHSETWVGIHPHVHLHLGGISRPVGRGHPSINDCCFWFWSYWN